MSRIGDEINRVEGVEKVTGHALYAADFSFPDLAYAALVQSEIPHGALDDEDLRDCASRAQSAPGVVKVISPLNCPPLNVLPREMTWDLPLERRPPLSDLSVQHVGQHIAVVANNKTNCSIFDYSMKSMKRRSLQKALNCETVWPS